MTGSRPNGRRGPSRAAPWPSTSCGDWKASLRRSRPLIPRLIRPQRTSGRSTNCEASLALGLPLRGVSLDLTDTPLDRPALVHLKRGNEGHFVVIRPVGHSGKLVQVIDPIDGVEVLDTQVLLSSAFWTGHAFDPNQAQ